MILENPLKDLEVQVRGGGKLVSHRPVFSPDGSTLHIIQSSTLLTYSTTSFLLTSRYTTPNSTPIANVHAATNDRILIFTTTGTLLTLNPATNTLVSSFQVNTAPKGWNPIATFTNFIHPTSETLEVHHFLALGYPQDSPLPVLYSISPEGLITKLCWNVVPSTHSAAVSPDGRFVAAIQEDTLYCKDMRDTHNCKWHSSGTRHLTAVAIHPTERFVVATGDDTGRVLIWNNVMTAQSPAKTVFHWHTLPVIDLAFSPEGSQMYSGGGECTLLKWDTGDTTNKRTLPRMGMPITHVASSPSGEFVAVSHEDNCVQVVDPFNRIVGVVKNFTTCEQSHEAGITVDPNSGVLVMNGRPGWLQAYDFGRDAHVYEVDVCQQNYVTAEREHGIPNCVVNAVAFSANGVWMATGEERRREIATESRLKFWKRDSVKGLWVLNTCVEWPHEGGLRGIRFRPGTEELSASTFGGKCVKTWGVAEMDSVVGSSEYWVCERVAGYKDLPAGGVCYSGDGSLVCAAFGRILTVWDGEGAFKLSLCHTTLQSDVRILEFGVKVNSHLIISCGEDYAAVWDVITASLLWVVGVKLDCVAVDPWSGVACGSSNTDVYVFSPDNSEPLAVHKNASKSRVRGMTWIRRGSGRTVVFLNGSDEVCGFVEKREGEYETVRVGEDQSRLTGFGLMVAERTVSLAGGGQREVGERRGDTEKGYALLREIMDSSPHSMPSPKYYCTQLLRSLSTRVTEAERQAEKEKLVMASGRREWKEEPKTLDTSFSSSAAAEERWGRVDLDEIANDDTTWISTVF